METFWLWLGRIADSVGTLSVIATLVFSCMTYLLVKREEKKYLKSVQEGTPTFDDFGKLLEANKGVRSEKPVALLIAVTTSNDSIKPNVNAFLKTQNWKMPTKEIKMNGIDSVEDQKRFLQELMTKKREITAEGYTEAHLFINAPMFACVLTGSILKHWIPTKIYHKPTPTPTQIYVYQTPLI